VIDTPQTRVEIVRSGLYRINVQPSNLTEVAVYKGRAMVGKDPAMKLTGGRTARVAGSAVEVAKLDKKEKDTLDLWSRERAKMLAKANGQLSTRNVNTLLASARDNYFLLSAGFWYLNPRTGCYVFIPGGDGWSSPYGFYYNNSFFFLGGRSCYSCRSWGYDNNGFGRNTGNGSISTGATGNSRISPSPVSKPVPQARPQTTLGKSAKP
jgi:hypothetical protein